MLLSEIVAGARQNPNLNRSYLPSSAYAEAPKYKVRPGDSLGKIAAELGISPEELSELNELSSPNLNIGDELVTSAEGRTTIIDQIIQAKELGAPLSQLEGALSPEAMEFAQQIYAVDAAGTTEVPEQETQVEATPATGITPEQPMTAEVSEQGTQFEAMLAAGVTPEQPAEPLPNVLDANLEEQEAYGDYTLPPVERRTGATEQPTEPLPNVLDANLEAVETDGIYATGLSHEEMAEVAARNSEQETQVEATPATGITAEQEAKFAAMYDAGIRGEDLGEYQQTLDIAADQKTMFDTMYDAGIRRDQVAEYQQMLNEAAAPDRRRLAFTSPATIDYKRGSNNTFAQIARSVEGFFEMVRHENTSSPEDSTLLLRKLTAIVGKNIQGSPDETVRTVAEIQTTPPKQTKPAHWTDSIIDGASELADIYEREAALWPAEVSSYKEVLDDPSKAPAYIRGAIVENLPNMVATGVGGVFGVPGMLAASASVLTGEYYKGMVDEGVAPHKAGATAIAMAIPGAMLEVGSFANILQAAFKISSKPPETILALVGTVLDRVVGAGLFESGTEQIQTMLGFIGTKLNKPEYEILSRKNLEELAEASVKAFAAGGGTSAVPAAGTQIYAYGGGKLKQTRVGKERVSKEAEIKLQDAIKNMAPDDDSMGWAQHVKAYVTAKQAELVGNTELYEQFNEAMVDFDARAKEALERATTYTEKTKTLHRIGDAYFAIVDYYGKDSKKDAAKVTAALNRVLGPVGTTETPPTEAYAADVALNDKDVASKVEQMLVQLRRIKKIKETGDLTAEQQKTIDLAKKAVEKLGGELRAGGISTEDVKARLVAKGKATATPTPTQNSTDKVSQESLESNIATVENNISNLRGEDGSVADENMAEFTKLQKELVEARYNAERGDNTGSIVAVKSRPTSKEGDPQVLVGKKVETAEENIETIITNGMASGSTTDAIIQLIINKYSFNSSDQNLFIKYVEDRVNNAPTVGNNKLPFSQWRRGETTQVVKEPVVEKTKKKGVVGDLASYTDAELKSLETEMVDDSDDSFSEKDFDDVLSEFESRGLSFEEEERSVEDTWRIAKRLRDIKDDEVGLYIMSNRGFGNTLPPRERVKREKEIEQLKKDVQDLEHEMSQLESTPEGKVFMAQRRKVSAERSKRINESRKYRPASATETITKDVRRNITTMTRGELSGGIYRRKQVLNHDEQVRADNKGEGGLSGEAAGNIVEEISLMEARLVELKESEPLTWDTIPEDEVNALLGEFDAANEEADVPQVDVAVEQGNKSLAEKQAPKKKYKNSGEQDLSREFALAQEQEEQTLMAQLEYDARKRIDMSSTYGEHYGPDLDLDSLPWAERLEANNGNWKQMMSLMSSADRQEAEQDKSFLEALEASGLSAKDMISRYDTQYDSSGEQHVNDPAEAQGSAKASLSAPLLIGKGDEIHHEQMPYARAAEDGSTTDATKKRLKAVEKAYPENDVEIVSAFDHEGKQYDYIAVFPSDTNDLSGVVFETEMHLRKARTEGNKKANSDSTEQNKDLIYIGDTVYDTIEITKLGLLKLAIERGTDYIREPNAADIYEAYWLGAEALIDAVDSNGKPLHSSLQENRLKSLDLSMTDETTVSPVIWRYKQSNVAGRPGQLDLTLHPTTIESGEKAYVKANNSDTSINDTVEKAVEVTDKNRAEVMMGLRKTIAVLNDDVERLENPARAQRSRDNAVLELIGHLKDALHALNPIQKQKRQLTQLRKLADSLSNKFDINNATVEELSAFRGIGAKTAEAIRAYLQDNPISDIGQLVGKVARVTPTIVDSMAGKILTPKERTQLEEIPNKIAELEALIKKPKQLNDWELARFEKLDVELDRLGMQGEAPIYSKTTVASTETLEQEFSKLTGSLPAEEVSIDAARKDFEDVTPESLRIRIPAFDEPSVVYNEDSGRQASSSVDDNRGAAKQINALVDTLQKQLDMLNDPAARADKGYDKLYEEAFKQYSVIRTATTMFQLDMYTRRESVREAAYDRLADLYAISLTDKEPGALSEAEARRVRRIEAKDRYPLSAMDRAVSTNLEELANYAKALTNHGFLELAAEANAKLKALKSALHTVKDNEINGYVPVGDDPNDGTAYDNKTAREGQKFEQNNASTDKLWRSNSNTSGGRVVQNAFSAITSRIIKLRNRRTPGDNIVNLGSQALGGLGKELAQIMLGTKSNFKVVLLDDAGIESLKAHNTIELPQFPLELMDADGNPVFTEAEIEELGSPYKSVVAALQGSKKALEAQLKAMGKLSAKSFEDIGKFQEAVAIQAKLKGIRTAIEHSVDYMTKTDVSELADTRKTMLLLDKLRNDGVDPATIDAHLETLTGVPRIEIVKKFEAHKKIVNPLYDTWTMEQLESRLPGGINEGTPGTTIYHKDHAIIYVDTKSSNKMEHRITLGHEFGHAFMGAAFAEAPKEIQEALVGAYESDPNAPTSIREWYADQMVAWLSDPDHIDKILNYKRNTATEKGVQSLADTLFEADLVKNKGALVTREVAAKQQAARQKQLSEARKELHLKVGRLFQSIKDGWARVHAWASKNSNLTPLNETFTEFMESVTSGVFDGGSTFNLDEGRLDNIAPIDMDPNPPTEEELTGFAADLGDTFTFAVTPNRRNRARAQAHRVLHNRGAGLRATLLSADQQLRMVGAERIANKLWLRPQTTAAQLPWINAVDQRSRQWGGQYEAVTADLTATQRLSAFQQMQNEQLSDEQIAAQENDPQVAEATKKLRKVHKEFGRYLEVAIPGFTSVANHFPRAYNTSRLETEAPAFIQFLVDEMGVSPERADILRRTILNEGETALSLNPATASGSTRARTITVDNATLLGGGWLHPDPQYALMSSVRKSIRHAELGRLFGGTQLDQAGNEYFDPSLEIQQVLGELPTATARNRARVVIEGILGQRGLSMDSTLRKYQNNIMAVQNWLTLLYTAVASPPELAGPILRAKDLGGATKALHSFIRTVKDPKEAYKRYGAMGFLEETLAHQAMSEVYGLDSKPSWASTANKNLFLLNGQAWFTNMSRVMSAAVGEDFILRHGVTAPDGHSESYLEELKLTPAIVARWDALGRPIWNAEEQFSESSVIAQKVQDAIGIFVDQSIVNPNNAIKPVFMSDARFALVSHLKTFYYSFQHTVLEGLWNNMKQKDGVTAKAVPAILAAFTMMPLSGLSLETRELLQYWGQKDPTANDDVDEYLWNLFRRAGGLGALELGMSALDAQGWNGSALTRLAGPTAGHIEAIFNAPDSGRGVSSVLPVVRQMPALKQLLFDND